MSKAKVFGLLEGILCIVLGILLCLSIINVNTWVKYIVGAVLILLGIYVAVRAFANSNMVSFIIPAGLLGVILIGMGIAIVADWLSITSILQRFILIAIVAAGALLLFEAIMNIYRRKTTLATIELVIAIAMLVIGILMIIFESKWSWVSSAIWIVFGIFLCLYGILVLMLTLTKLGNKANRETNKRRKK